LGGHAFVPEAVDLEQVSTDRLDRKALQTLVKGDNSGYLLIQGSVIDRETAAAALRKSGATIVRIGRYMGDPLDGLSPDWFVRFELGEATFDTVADAVGAPDFDRASAGESAADLRSRLLITELGQARVQIATAKAEIARLRLELAEISARAVVADVHADVLVRLEDERAALQEALIAESQAREAAEAVAREAEPSARRPEAPRALTAEIETVLRAMTPRVRLIRDSLAFCAVELSDRAHLYRILAQLEGTPMGWPAGWKKLKALAGWWERHLSDGVSDAGRIYARLDPSDRCLEVLVSTKGDQQRDIAWLQRP
jgi:hypothetical protein